MIEIQGKLILVKVRARFELASFKGSSYRESTVIIITVQCGTLYK